MYRADELNLGPGDLVEFRFLSEEGEYTCKARVLRPKFPSIELEKIGDCIIVEYMEEMGNELVPSGEIYALNTWSSLKLIGRAKHP